MEDMYQVDGYHRIIRSPALVTSPFSHFRTSCLPLALLTCFPRFRTFGFIYPLDYAYPAQIWLKTKESWGVEHPRLGGGGCTEGE